MKTMLMAVVAGICVAMGAGCASQDGRIHTPITGLSTHRAYALAEQNGWVRVAEATGDRVWVRFEALRSIDARLMATDVAPQERFAALADRIVLAQTTGKTDAQMVQAYNARGVGLAKLGDGALATAIAGGIVAAIAAANDEGGSAVAAPTVSGQQDTNNNKPWNSPAVGSVTTGDGSPVSITQIVTAMPPE